MEEYENNKQRVELENENYALKYAMKLELHEEDDNVNELGRRKEKREKKKLREKDNTTGLRNIAIIGDDDE